MCTSDFLVVSVLFIFLVFCVVLCSPQICWWCPFCSSFQFSVLCCVHLRYFGGVHVAHLFCFLCCVVFTSDFLVVSVLLIFLVFCVVLCCVHLRFCGGVRVVHLCSFLCCVLFCFFVCVHPVSCVPNAIYVSGLSIHDWPVLWFSLTFIFVLLNTSSERSSTQIDLLQTNLPVRMILPEI